MRIERRNTTEGQSPYAGIDFRLTTSEIRNPDGSVVFRLENVEVPEFWSQVASDVLAQKYFRKAGVAARLKKVEEETVPSWLWRSVPDTEALAAIPESERYVSELSAKQVFDRLAGCWTYWGWKGGYFTSEEDARAFSDELRYMLAKQMVAPNSPQWFNTGLHWAYGVDGPGQGHYYVDWKTGKLTKSKSSYEHPQPHACFIQGIEDDLVNEGGIMDLWVREARLFKYGSGTGSHFSRPRGEDGGGRRRPSRHRNLYRLEGEGGAEGRGAGDRLQAQSTPPQGGAEGLRQLRRLRRRLFRPREEPGAAPRDQARAPGDGRGRHDQARDPVRPPRLQGYRFPGLRHRLGFGSLSHGIGPELQQFGIAEGRFSARGRDGW